jgi:hypothetical protein
MVDYPWLGYPLLVLELVGLAFLLRWKWFVGMPIFGLWCFVAGHLWFGTPIKHDEQEFPPYIRG